MEHLQLISIENFQLISMDWETLQAKLDLDYEIMQTFDAKDWANEFLVWTADALRVYYWVLTLRLSVQWFPNINPYIHPVYVLLHATDFFLESFEGIVPNILGMDMSAMCAFIFLEWVIRTCQAIKFY